MKRIAIVEKEKCVLGKRCEFLCGKYCPVNKAKQDCIIIKNKKPVINEELCTGCGICVKRCPAHCIHIIRLPDVLDKDPVHRHGINGFELYGLPLPKKGKIIGLVGKNGIGKTTSINILTGNIHPNFGRIENPPNEQEIIEKYSGTILAKYFEDLFGNRIRIAHKPQRIDLIPRIYKGKVMDLINKVDESGKGEEMLEKFNLVKKKSMEISKLSGGELQKLAIIGTVIKKADLYFFDEPSSFLDVTTRMMVAKLIKNLSKENNSIIVVEHDLTTLDYISDEIQVVYGVPACYGAISQPKTTNKGINEYLDGYLPEDNVRFRSYSIKFFKGVSRKTTSQEILLEFPKMSKSFDGFKLEVNKGLVHKGEIMAVMGANGLGKTTFLRLLTGELKPDEGTLNKYKIAYKPQYLSYDIKGTVREFLIKAAKDKFSSGWYKQNILEKLGLGKILDNEIKDLSGGELQKTYIALTLSRDCEIFAFDEPSAFIDVEDRLIVAEVIKDFILNKEACAIVVDHDVQFIDYIGDSMLVFSGIPGKEGHVFGPCSKEEGMNTVLKMLDVTYRHDKETFRPRINKPGSRLDRLQRKEGKYYYT